MKRICFFVGFAMVGLLSTKAFAQTLLQNWSGCPVDIWVICYDYSGTYSCADPNGPSNCCIVSETQYTLEAGEEMVVADCPNGEWTTYKVNWQGAGGTGAYVTWEQTPVLCYPYYPLFGVLTGPCNSSVQAIPGAPNRIRIN